MAFIQQPRRAAQREVAREDEVVDSKGKGKSKESSALTKSSKTSQLDESRSSRSGSSRRKAPAEESAKDWSVVFPGRPARASHSSSSLDSPGVPSLTPSTPSPASITNTPFLGHDDVDAGSISPSTAAAMPQPPLHDGTGRFARSTSIARDSEAENDSSPPSPVVQRRRAVSPITLLRAPLSDSVFLGSLSEGEEIDLNDDAASLASSAELFSETESEEHDRLSKPRRASSSVHRIHSTSSASTKQQRGRLDVPPASMRSGSASWAWMHAPQHQQSPLRRRASDLSAILTSDSEGEVEVAPTSPAIEEQLFKSAQFIELDEVAFEEALATTHSAQSAGLRSRTGRVPKRRHRRNGESEKGSKRSNNSAAIVASDVRSAAVLSGTSAAALLQQRRQALSEKRSVVSAASTRARLRLQQQQRQKRLEQQRADIIEEAASDDRLARTPGQHPTGTRGQRLVSSLLRGLFGVDDAEVLSAFLHNDGPLRIEPNGPLTTRQHDVPSTSAFMAATASRNTFGERADTDDVWSRNQRNRRLRLLVAGEEYNHYAGEAEENDSDAENASPGMREQRYSKGSAATGFRPPHRVHVSSNVAEPSLVDALQASVMSGLRVLPSGISMLMAGSHSVRLVNYLVGRIGPQLSERMRKLLDDDELAGGAGGLEAADDESTSTLRQRSGTMTSSSASSSRFTGAAHPALSTNSTHSSPRR